MQITKIVHSDHGINTTLLEWAANLAAARDGFVVDVIQLPEWATDLQSALYGPSVGDAPVPEEEVEYVQRSPDRPPSRMVRRPLRSVRSLVLIGNVDRADGTMVIYTAYGGTLAAPREPGDATLETEAEREESRAFWATHALATGENR